MYFETRCNVRATTVVLSLDYGNDSFTVSRLTSTGYMWSFYKCRDAAHARRVFLSYRRDV